MANPSLQTAEKRVGRGYCLLSGGLDSQLSICVLRAQGLYVEALVFASPFFKIESAKRAAKALDIPLHIVPFTADIISLVQSPPHGFGGAMNPCIDCHANMIKRAGEMMVANGFDFVATGEVLNQRPMSQTRNSLKTVERDSGLNGRLLRPLCALHLEPTIPEQEGIVDRTRLLDLSGRSRKPQMELAKQFGLVNYPSPAGGCLLTEKGFCRKLMDLKTHEGLEAEHNVWLLLYGRHFRLPGGAKCIVGRDAHDNAALKRMKRENDILLHTVNVPGPSVLLSNTASESDVEQAFLLCASYGDIRGRTHVVVRIVRGDDTTLEKTVTPCDKNSFQSLML